MLRQTSQPLQLSGVSIEPPRHRIQVTRYRLLCGKCSEICFVNETTFRRASRAIMEGSENPFLCGKCDEGPDIWLFAE